jgi:hypothetical protein
LEELVFETGNEILEGIQEVAVLEAETIDKMLMEDLEKRHLSPAKQLQQDATDAGPEPGEGTDNSHTKRKLVDAQGTRNQSAFDKEGIESSDSEAKMPTRIDAHGTVQETEEDDGDMADQDLKAEDGDMVDQENEEGDGDMPDQDGKDGDADQDIKDEDADMADVEDNCDANSEDQNVDTETSDGWESGNIKSENEDLATPTQSEGGQVDEMSSDGDDDSSETPKELEFEDDTVRLEQLEQSYLWGETTEEETDGSDGDYSPDKNSEDEEEEPPVKKRRL